MPSLITVSGSHCIRRAGLALLKLLRQRREGTREVPAEPRRLSSPARPRYHLPEPEVGGKRGGTARGEEELPEIE